MFHIIKDIVAAALTASGRPENAKSLASAAAPAPVASRIAAALPLFYL